MALTRTQLTQEEAINLASIIDKSQLPVHVKRVTNDNIVEVQDDQTGYVLPIWSYDHWTQYARQAAGANSIDEFAGAGIALLARLDDTLNALKQERDLLLSQAEQVDTHVAELQSHRDVIEAAVKAVDNMAVTAVFSSVSVQPTAPPNPKRQLTPKANSGVRQNDWVLARLHELGRVKVSLLAVEMIQHYALTKGEAIKRISGVMSRLLQINPQIKRVAPGEYVLIIEGTMS